MRRRWILDCETTSLHPDYDGGTGVIWEIAVLDPDSGEEHMWRMQPNLAAADPQALLIGQFYERTRLMRYRDGRVYDLAARDLSRGGVWTDPKALAPVLARLLDAASVTCAIPTFDKPYVAAFLQAHGQALTAHYRWRCIESMAYGWLTRLRSSLEMPDFDSGLGDFATALGVDITKFKAHSALGDCQLAAAMLAVIEGHPR